MSFKLSREHRILTGAELRRVMRRGRRKSLDRLDVFILGTELPSARIGFAVSRKAGCAVKRNFIRRMWREAFRLEREALGRGLDLVVRPAPGYEPGSLEELRSILRQKVREAEGG